MERTITFLPAFDRRDPDPKKNYGIHGATMLWTLKKKLGGVTFTVYTNWMLPHVEKELESNPTHPRILDKPMAADISYHSPVATKYGYAQQHCEVTGGPCWSDGSALDAMELLQTLIAKGSEAVWELMEAFYISIFEVVSAGEAIQ